MKRVYIYAIISFGIIFLILFVLYNRYSNYIKEENRYKIISKNIDILNDNLEFEKKYALSLVLFISKNQNLKKALMNNSQKMALTEIDNFLKSIKKATGIDNIDIQVHTKNLKAFARSWDKGNYFGDDISFRKGLVRVKNTQEPFVSIELGKRLNIKAISPVFDNKNNYIGSVEIIMNFANIKRRLKKFGLEMLALLDNRYINIATDLKNHKTVGRYYVVENNYPKELFEILKNSVEILSTKQAYYIYKNHIIVSIPMLSVGIEDVGIIVLSMNRDIKRDTRDNSAEIKRQNREYKFNGAKRSVVIK